MADTPLLWASGARKEVMDLLTSIWTTGESRVRDQLAKAIVQGPPEKLLALVDVDGRQEFRDRRIFDRIDILSKVSTVPLNATLQAEADRLHRTYPSWRTSEGEQAHFNVWTDSIRGFETHYGVEDLRRLDDEALADILTHGQELREGLLDAWRQLGNTDPERVVSLLERLAQLKEETPSDLWQYGLWGVREAAKQPELWARLVVLLEALPPTLFQHAEVSSAVADLLETATASQPSLTNDETFWRLFDRTLLAVKLDRRNAEPADRDWVSRAINQSLGHLAGAFFSALFARGLKVGAGLPNELLHRLDALVAPNITSHRLARVIAASRLSYLFAVDPKWTEMTLIPSFDWASDEDEALAVWQGYAWQPRIDRKLWSALKPYFLLAFSPTRLERLDKFGRSIAQIMMLVGIEFGIDELSRTDGRKAIRAMPDEMRADAVSWIVSFLEHSNRRDPAEDPARAQPSKANNADSQWVQKVSPWLKRVWPPDPDLRTPSTAEQFALVAIATDGRFPDAVKTVTPFLVPANAYFVHHQLARSRHPEHHPLATLNLIDAITDPNAQRLSNELEKLLERVRDTDPALARNATFRTWNERVRVRR